ncbi:MAG: hypothetical protein ACTSPA_10205 [Promethearchaeota archaeon]
MKKIPIVQEIWIIMRNGLSIFSQNIGNDQKKTGIEGDMFSGFVAAINAFTSEIGLDKCRVIETKSSKIVFSHFHSQSLTFVGRSSKNIDNSEIYDYLDSVKSVFLLKYKNVISNWNGSVSEFKGISKNIDIVKDKKNWK